MPADAAHTHSRQGIGAWVAKGGLCTSSTERWCGFFLYFWMLVFEVAQVLFGSNEVGLGPEGPWAA